MRRALLALGVAMMAALGAVPAATSLAAKTHNPSNFSNYLIRPGSQTLNDQSSGWTMVKPIIPVTTSMVIPHNNVTGTSIAQFALRFVGYRYTLVGNSPALGFSCIGLVSYVYQSLGIPLPDELGNARAFAPPVSLNALQPGDILWFGNTVWPGLSHTAIYLGSGRFVHAAWFNRGVITSSLRNDPVDGNYWIDHYLGASRPWGGAGVGSFGIPTTVQAIPDVPAVMVIVSHLNLRRWWSLRAPVRQVVDGATPLNIIRRTGHWYQVMTPDGTEGWIATAKLARTPMPRAARHIKWHHISRRRTAHYSSRGPFYSWQAWSRGITARRVGSQHVRRLIHAGARHRLRKKSRSHMKVRRSVRHLAIRWTRVNSRQLVLLVVHVRAAPGLHAHVLGLIMPKTHIRVLARGGDWKRVRLAGGRVGYIYAKYLR